MGSEFVRHVSLATLVLLGPVAAGGAWAVGWPGAVGGLAGGLIALSGFRWIASGVTRVVVTGSRGGRALSSLAVGARHLVLFGALAGVLGSGVAHPLALIAGLSVLPPVIIALGLRAAAESR